MNKKIKKLVDKKVKNPGERIYKIAEYDLEFPITEEGYANFLKYLLKGKEEGVFSFFEIDHGAIIEQASCNLRSNLEEANQQIKKLTEKEGEDIQELMVEAKILIASKVDVLVETHVIQEGFEAMTAHD